MEDGFKFFPVDIWRLLLNNYCDFKTRQSLSCANKRLRGFFHDNQMKRMKLWSISENRIYDIDFDVFIESKVYLHFINDVISQSYGEEYQTKTKFVYVLYKFDNNLRTINYVKLEDCFNLMIVKDIELIQAQTNFGMGMCLDAYFKNRCDIVNSIMYLY